MPAAASAIAASCPAWFVLNTTARSPASTPKRSAYRRAAEASITPGRSLRRNPIGRSWAPVASTTRRARTWRTRSIGADALVHHHVPVVVDAERGRIGEHGDLRGARERGGGGGDPRVGGGPVDRVGGGHRAPTQDRSSTSITRSPAAAASVAARRPAMPAPTTIVSTCAWRWRASGAPARRRLAAARRPAREVATSPSTSGTASPARWAEHRRRRARRTRSVPRRRPTRCRAGGPAAASDATTSTPFASSALASVSPTKPSYATPSKVSASGRDRSTPWPAGAGSRRPLTWRSHPRTGRDLVRGRVAHLGRTNDGSPRRASSAPSTIPSGCRA